MNADERRYPHSEITELVIRVFYEVYNELGFGFLESVYKAAMLIALRKAGVTVSSQCAIPVWFRGEQIRDFRADFIVEGKLILELKAARAVEPSHVAQLLNYLRATNLEIGLILNFGPHPGIRRLAFSNDRKSQHSSAFVSG